MDNENQPTEDDLISNTVRALAQHVVILALVRTHPDLQTLRDTAEPYAEATRANLLASGWSDAQIEQFDKSLDLLLKYPSPRAAT